MSCSGRVGLLLCLLLGGVPRPAMAREGWRPIDLARLDLGEYRTEWKESWEATYEANKKAWEQELQGSTPDKSVRGRRLSARLVALLEELVQRYPDDAPRRRAACEEMAERLAELGCRGRANLWLKRLVDECPGQPDLVAATLYKILGETQRAMKEMEEGEEWVAHAADRLIALSRAGHLPETHAFVESAWKAKLALALGRDQVWEAAQALERLEACTNRDDWWRIQQAELLFRVGRREEALQRFEELEAQNAKGDVSGWIQRLSREAAAGPPTFQTRSTLEARWEGVRARPVAEGVGLVQELLDEGARGETLVPLGTARHASLWAVVDRHLRASDPAALAPLRESEQRAARRLVAGARAAGSLEGLVAAYRRCPWAGSVHQALLESGERWLRRGWSGLAFRAFQDVLSHTSDPTVRSRAQVGLVLSAWSEAGRSSAVEAALRGVPDPQLLPWLGERKPAGKTSGVFSSEEKTPDVVPRLGGGPRQPEEGPAAIPPLAELSRRVLRMPPASPWVLEDFRPLPDDVLEALPSPLGQLQVAGGRVVLSGPNLLACYGEDLTKPLWWRTPGDVEPRPSEERQRLRHLIIPGPFLPEIAGDRIYSRWGLDASGQRPAGLAAFDADTGELLWSTARDPQWEKLTPVSDPAAADGRVYVLALSASSSVAAPVSLVCLNADDGAWLWQRPLASQSVGLLRAEGWHRIPKNEVDLTQYSHAPLVHQGAVYCATNLGFVARCDARDGLVEWARTYPRARLGGSFAVVARRQGAKPIVVGETVVFVPRDYAGAFALDRETGTLLWDNPFLPSDEAVGVAGETVVLRNAEHLAAVAASSGRLLWDRAFPEGLRGRAALVGGEVLVRTRKELHRIAAGTGQAVERIEWGGGEPVHEFAVRDTTLVALTDRVAATTPAAPPLPPGEGVGEGPRIGPGPRPRAPHPTLSQGERADAASPLQLPLKLLWELPRPEPTAWTPPVGANLVFAPLGANTRFAPTGKVFVFSQGVLACLSAGPELRIEWQRVVRPGFSEVAWAGRTSGVFSSEEKTPDVVLLLVYPQRVLALDPLSGECRWETEVPVDTSGWCVCGEYLFVGKVGPQGGGVGAIRLATGELLWHREALVWSGRQRVPLGGLGWDGKQFHFLSERARSGKEGVAQFVVRPTDGQVVALRVFAREQEPWQCRLPYGEGVALLVSGQKGLWEQSLSDGSVRRYPVSFAGLDLRRIDHLELPSAWAQVCWQKGAEGPADKHWVLRRSDPSYLLRRKHWGAIQGDKLYEQPDGVPALTVVDLPTKREIAYTLPAAAQSGQFRKVIALHESGNRMWVASQWHAERGVVVRLDCFDLASAAHLGMQVLPPGLGEEPQFAWSAARTSGVFSSEEKTPDVVLGVGSYGIYCFASDSADGRRPAAALVAYRLARPIVADGSLDDWPAQSAALIAAEGKENGSLHVAHDEEHVYVAARYRDARAAPWAGPAARAGDWLELELSTTSAVHRWALGLDRRGRPAADALGHTPVPEGMQAAARHDPVSQEVIWELAIPSKSLFASRQESRRMWLSAAAWDDRPAAGGAVRLAQWGRISDFRFPISDFRPQSAIGNRQSAIPYQESIYLDALTSGQEEAASAIIHELPDLPASFDLFRRSCEARAPSGDALEEWYWEFVRRHPRSASAERLLHEIDRLEWEKGTGPFSRSPGPSRDREGAAKRPLANARGSAAQMSPFPIPSRDILAAAARAGVPEPVLRRFALESKAYLSQWVHIAEGTPPRMVLLELNSGVAQPDEWGHRAFWGKEALNWTVPPCPMGTIEELGRGKWSELRIPLAWIGMHDKPLCGINFCQQGGPRIAWDRSAVVVDGKEKVFLDDDLPKGSTRRTWEWVTEPVHSGKRAHTQPPPKENYELMSHTLAELDEPIVDHLAEPLDRPYLSQWVWLDPANPPRMVAMDLYDGRAWPFCGIWGEKRRQGRYMGPLPRPGQWHELRLPLAWTPFATRPIGGIAFGHLGGRVVWDRTALAVGGKEHVLIEDDTPAVATSGPLVADGASGPLAPTRQEWLGWLETSGHRYIGGVLPTDGKRGVGLRCDGRSGYVEVPHSPALDPPRLTVEAWVQLDSYSYEGDARRWIVSKNRHESTDGHFGLVVVRDKTGAYLNIGGGEENRFQVWSPPDTLKLNQWHHLAMTYDGSMLRLFTDGKDLGGIRVDKPRVPGTMPLHIGRREDGYVYFRGAIDEVRFYSRALSPDEIQARYASGGAPPEKATAEALVGHWGFDGEAASVLSAPDWQWVEQPAKSGRRAHTQPPRDGYAGHSVAPLQEPIVVHLPFDRPRAIALLKEQLPRVGPTDEAWRFFGDLLQLELPGSQRLAELNRWFLSTFPDHPRVVDVLGNLLGAYTELRDPNPAGRVEALFKEFGLPLEVLYRYHRRYARPERDYLRAWQVIGPFRAEGDELGLATRYPPEVDGARLDKVYPGAAGEVRWQLCQSESDYVNLRRRFERPLPAMGARSPAMGAGEGLVAYAVAWVYSDQNRPVTLAVGSDDFCRVWINRTLVLTGRNRTYASPGEFVVPTRLSAGWNEILVKVTQDRGEWGLYFEILDELARKMPDGLKVATTPPGLP